MVDISIIGCCHGAYDQLNLAGGDLLIVTGDITARDEISEYEAFVQWLNRQDYKKKIVIGGNHDNCLQREGAQLFKWAANTEYLCDSGTQFHGTDKHGVSYTMKIFGSPWSLTFPNMNPKCKAFTCETEEEIANKWAMIPIDTDILITHTPPYGILDGISIKDGSEFHVGSKSLLNWLGNVGKPQLHCFSHIHENGHGKLIYKREGYGDENNTICVNASIMNERYKPTNDPVRIIL